MFFFWLLASGFWLLAFGFWLLAPSVSGFWFVFAAFLEPKSLICVLFAAVWSQFACPFGFWLLALASLDSWLLVFGFCCFCFALVSLGFWLLAALLLNECVVL